MPSLLKKRISFSAPPPLSLPLDLPEVEVLSVVKEIHTFGHSPIQIEGVDGNIYVVKNAAHYQPPCFIISEFLGHFFCRTWGLPTPEGAIMRVSPAFLEDNANSLGLSRRHLPRYYDRPCFASKWVPLSSDLEPLHNTRNLGNWRHLHNFSDLLLLALFDIWLANDDRGPSKPNMIHAPLAGKRAIWLAIDHAFCFSSLNYDQLVMDDVGVSWNDSLLCAPPFSNLKRLVKRAPNWSEIIKSAFKERIESSKAMFPIICSAVPKELNFDLALQTKVYEFLFNDKRLKLVLQEYLSHF